MINNWRQILEEMDKIYRINYKGSVLSCALLPYDANTYLNALVEAEKNIKSMADINKVTYYRKIEKVFVDDKNGTTEMNKLLTKFIR